MDNPKITLAIFGNQNSNSGFQPLYWINNPAQQLENLVPPGMEENPYFFVIETGPLFTQYTLIQNHVSSYMSSRPGVLKMAIGIPKGYRLGNNESPMDVLLGVRKIFIDTCMTQKSALTESYNFNEKLVEPDELISYIDGFQLRPALSKHREMTGSDDALLLLDKETTATLFKDVQYPEFTHYRRIIVAEKGNASTYKNQLANLEIPRKTQLQLIVNGQAVAWPVANYYEESTTIELSLNKRCWEYTPARFTVNELLNHEINDPANGLRVYIDYASETVVCNITPRKKRKTIQVSINGCQDTTRFMPRLTILVGPRKRQERLSAQGTITLEGDDIMFLYTKELKALYQGRDYIITRQTLTDDSLAIDVEGQVINPPITRPVVPTIPIPATVAAPDNTPKSKAMLSKKQLIALLIALLCIALGIWLLFSLFSKDKDIDDDTLQGAAGDPTEMRDTPDDEDDDDDDFESVMSLFNENKENYEQMLKDPNLTFDQVDEMAKWVDNEDVVEQCREDAPQLVNTIKNYQAIVNAIRNGHLEEAVSIQETNGKPLYVVHLWQLNAAYKGWVDNNGTIHTYQKESADKARRQFDERYQTFKSFKDIDRLHENKVEDRTSPYNGMIVPDWPTAVSPAPQPEQGQRQRQDQRQRVNERGNASAPKAEEDRTDAVKSNGGMPELD